jgi:L-amino acid N-acyltransferase YncA
MKPAGCSFIPMSPQSDFPGELSRMENAAAFETEPPVVVRPSRDEDVESMLAIYRRHIRRGVEESAENSGMPEPDDLRQRRKNLRNHRLPHIVATFRGEVVGYAYVVQFRKRPAYRFTAKHSIYVHHEHLGRGVGRLLMQGLIDACAAAGFRQMIGYIDADNAASLAIHERFGFNRVGLLPGVAYRYGRWSDTVMVQRSLGPGTNEPPLLGR